MKTAMIITVLVAWLAGSSLAQTFLGCNHLVGNAVLNSSLTAQISIDIGCTTMPSSVSLMPNITMTENTGSWTSDLVPAITETRTTIVPRTVHTIEVGSQFQLLFNPSQVRASKGDMITFQFPAFFNHSVTESSLSEPCKKRIGGFDSGFRQTQNGQGVVAFEVQDTQPRWFFCAQDTPSNHCEAGMVFGLNPGSNMNQFLDNARQRHVSNATTTNTSVPIVNSSAVSFNSESTQHLWTTTSDARGFTTESVLTSLTESSARETTTDSKPEPLATSTETVTTDFTTSKAPEAMETSTTTSIIEPSNATSSEPAPSQELSQGLDVSLEVITDRATSATAKPSPPFANTTSLIVTSGEGSAVGNLTTPSSTSLNDITVVTGTVSSVVESSILSSSPSGRATSTPAGLEVQTFTGAGALIERNAICWVMAVSLFFQSIVYFMLA